MRLLLSVVLAGGSLVFAIAALAQSTTTATPTVPVNPAAAVPVAGGKRFACQAASQGFKGQEQKDQMQLCMAQARLDCLKQAIDQKIIGPQRRDFIKNCVQDVPAE
jgi:Spy/CpxP family protein refolding chaperone